MREDMAESRVCTNVGSSKSGRRKDASTRRRRRLRCCIWVVFVPAGVVGVSFLWGCCLMTKMPGTGYKGPLPALTDSQTALADELKNDVEELADRIGERNLWHYSNYMDSADFIESMLTKAGCAVARQDYEVMEKTCYNITGEMPGARSADEIVLIGAHYDSFRGTCGANDNGSAVAAALALARRLADKESDRTLRFVFFANEEPPFFQTEDMGSWVYAKGCRARGDNIIAMLSLETMGYYSDEPKSQNYPFPFSLFYPSTGNFIAFVSNMGPSKQLLREVMGSFRQNCRFPSVGAAIPGGVAGVGWSDHWAFWQEGYRAIMITDTAPFRYEHYHTAGDTPDRIDYERLARVVSGLEAVILEMARI